MNINGIHRKDKRVIGIFAWMPLACLITYIYHILTIYHEGIPDSHYYTSEGEFVRIETEIFILMLIFFIVYVAMGFASLYVMKFYIINHIATKNESSKALKAVWVVFTVLLGTFIAPVYYHVIIARSPGIWEEKPPLFDFE